jgi:hypothetical protein
MSNNTLGVTVHPGLYAPLDADRRHEPQGIGEPQESPIGSSGEAQAVGNTLHGDAGNIRQFDTGATRSADAGRYDPEGFLSPLSIERYCQYMGKNQIQADGSVRTSDNWQKGLPIPSYMKGMWRHFLHLWTRHRGYPVQDEKAAADIEEDLCALLFNVQGMLHEVVKARLQR